MLTKFQFHCSITCRDILYFVLTSILSHLMTSSVPNLHNTKILNIYGTRWDMTKRKTPFFFTFKGLSNSPIFQYLNFSFHRHFEDTLLLSLFIFFTNTRWILTGHWIHNASHMNNSCDGYWWPTQWLLIINTYTIIIILTWLDLWYNRKENQMKWNLWTHLSTCIVK